MPCACAFTAIIFQSACVLRMHERIHDTDRNVCRQTMGIVSAISHVFFDRSEHISATAVMSSRGLLDVKLVEGCVNGDEFYSFVHTHLLPHLQPFNGENPHSIVVLDNAAIHHIHDAPLKMLESPHS